MVYFASRLDIRKETHPIRKVRVKVSIATQWNPARIIIHVDTLNVLIRIIL